MPIDMPMDMMQTIYAFDLLGTAVFALTGALAAARKEMDIFGFCVIALAPAVGGGTIRDLILGLSPVFWVRDPNYLYVCLAVAVMTFFFAHKVSSRLKLLIWADALGLALFAVIGAQKAVDLGYAPIIAITMGVITATAGGMIRDILCTETPLILRREIYALAAMAGSVTYVVTDQLDLADPIPLVAGFVAALAVRGPAIYFGWSLPVYRRD